jgi:hypothetical protein
VAWFTSARQLRTSGNRLPDLPQSLWDRLPIAKIVNVKVIGLEQVPEGHENFDAGVANKFVIDPHGQLPQGGLRQKRTGCITD